MVEHTEDTTTEINDDELDVLLDNVLSDFDSPTKKTDLQIPLKNTKNGDQENALDSLLKEASDNADLQNILKQMEKQFDDFNMDKELKTSAKSFESRIDERISRIQDTSNEIKEKLKESPTDASDFAIDPMSDIMKQMESMLESKEFDSMLDNVMESLMTKGVLYEPLKDLADSYDPWLEENKGKLESEQLIKYKGQLDCLHKMLDIYQSVPENEETSNEQNSEIVEWLDKMQKFGDPPAEILKKFAPDMDIGTDGKPLGKTGLAGILAGSSAGEGSVDNPDCSIM